MKTKPRDERISLLLDQLKELVASPERQKYALPMINEEKSYDEVIKGLNAQDYTKMIYINAIILHFKNLKQNGELAKRTIDQIGISLLMEIEELTNKIILLERELETQIAEREERLKNVLKLEEKLMQRLETQPEVRPKKFKENKTEIVEESGTIFNEIEKIENEEE